ncbi:TIGR03089 family protein [Promicromonospora thailandica]|uniref:TIGR03089 family protein n=1 Tax=Promicromonospora thailandica TaxID=765201 RepID=A0A9X2G397_9MICO|nr:TIGR03089 family protein [Promicromonospora thailandica]MCP2266084.1 TIGR03089 family protein [Promicromonospora thailandica]BFF20545.1 TIGR03089 family protein [Promicromonospora thailandica]
MQIASRTGGPVPDVASLLARLAADGGRPRLTWYGDDGERVELSGAVLANWASKTVNLLVEEFDAAPGTRVVVDLPAHWRTAVWALAAWRTGATVELPEPGADAAPDVVVTAEPGRWADGGADLVVVSLPALARRYDGDLPAGAVDAAAAVMTYGDVIGWVPEVDPGQDALVSAAGAVGHRDLVPAPGDGARVLVDGRETVADVLRELLGIWAGGGSAVLTSAATAAELEQDEPRRTRLLSSEQAQWRRG